VISEVQHDRFPGAMLRVVFDLRPDELESRYEDVDAMGIATRLTRTEGRAPAFVVPMAMELAHLAGLIVEQKPLAKPVTRSGYSRWRWEVEDPITFTGRHVHTP